MITIRENSPGAYFCFWVKLILVMVGVILVFGGLGYGQGTTTNRKSGVVKEKRLLVLSGTPEFHVSFGPPDIKPYRVFLFEKKLKVKS